MDLALNRSNPVNKIRSFGLYFYQRQVGLESLRKKEKCRFVSTKELVPSVFPLQLRPMTPLLVNACHLKVDSHLLFMEDLPFRPLTSSQPTSEPGSFASFFLWQLCFLDRSLVHRPLPHTYYRSGDGIESKGTHRIPCTQLYHPLILERYLCDSFA